jgi:exonuclease III
MAGISTYLPIQTLNVNGLNSPIKKKKPFGKLDYKGRSNKLLLQETHLIDRNKHWLRVKGWKKIYQANGP